MTSFGYATKEYFSDQKIQSATYQNRPALAMIPKYEDFYGESYRLPVTYADIGSRSAAFATAYANKGAFAGAKFLLTRASDYVLADLDNQTLLATSNDKGAFMKAGMATVESALNSIANTMENDLFSDGGGSRGQASSPGASTTFTLVDIEDIVRWEVGYVVAASANSDGSSPRTGTQAVTAINRDAGVLTGAANWTTAITSFANNDYIFMAGDTGTSGGKKIKGFLAWVPTSAPGATTFFGVDRSVDTARLGGVRIDGTALPIEEAVVGCMYKIFRDGNGMPDKGYMGPNKYRDFVNALGSKVLYTEHKVGEVGFTGIKVIGSGATAEIFPAWAQKNSRCHLLTTKDWGFYSLKKAPQIIEQQGPNGNVWHYNLSADTWQLTCGYYGQVGCAAPGRSGVVSL